MASIKPTATKPKTLVTTGNVKIVAASVVEIKGAKVFGHFILRNKLTMGLFNNKIPNTAKNES